MLTKQLQTLIDVSLSAGRSFDDIRDILQLQGFGDEAIDQLFAAYRERPSRAAAASAAGTPVAAAPAAPTLTPAAVPVPPPAAPAPTPAPTAAPAAQPPHVYEAPVIMPNAGVGVAAPVTQAAAVAPAATPPTAPTQPEPVSVGTVVSSSATMPDWAQAPAATPPPGQSAAAPSYVPPAAPSSAFTAAPNTAPAQAAPIDLSRAFDAPAGPVGMQAPTAAPLRGTLDQPIPTFSTMPAAGSINVGLGGMPELEQAEVEAYQRKLEKSPVRMLIVLFVVIAMIAGFAYWFFTLGPGAPIAPQVSITDVRTATSTVNAPEDLSNQPLADIDPFTGAPRSVDPVPDVPIAAPSTAAGCVFITDLALDDTGDAVTQVQQYFTDIGVFAKFAEQGRVDGTAPNFTITPGTFDKQMQLAVRYYQTVMFAGDRSNANVQPGIIDFPTRAVMEDDCSGGKFERYHQAVLDEALNQQSRAAVASVRVHIFSYFDETGTYFGACERSPQVLATLETINQVAGSIGGAICRATNSDWIVATPLHGVGGYYCTDSNQNTGEVATLLSNQMRCK